MAIRPKISVLTPVYNSEKYLTESIESILKQSFSDFELIVIDDGSTDTSLEIINSFKDPRIKFFSNGTNRGISYTRNRCIEVSSGEYLAVLDSDDIALPKRLEMQVEFLEENPEFGMIGSWFEYIDKSGNVTGEIAQYPIPADIIPVVLLFNNYFAHSTVMIRRTALPNIFYNPNYLVCEDYDLWIRIAEHNKVWNLPEVLVRYRVHNTNISKQSTKIDSFNKIILQNQLAKIGDFSEEEIEICFKLSKRSFLSSSKFIQDTFSVLSKLYILNKEKLKYDSDILKEFLGGLLFQVLFSTKKYNFNTYRAVQDSLFSNYINKSAGGKFKFLSKCLVGQIKGK